jgi:hypothetical protein
MRIYKIILLAIVSMTGSAFAQSYKVDWYVVGTGGGHSQSDIYRVEGTIGQTILGHSNSDMYRVDAGFWAGITGAGCKYIPGNSNGDESFNGIDVVYSINYLKAIGPTPPDHCDCPHHGILLAAADANGNCEFNGIDVTYSVNYLKGNGPAPRGCFDCLPIGN